MIPEGVDRYRHHLRGRLADCHVPLHLWDGVIEYVVARRPVGGFLTAVLENDLREAAARADEASLAGLGHLLVFLNNYVTGRCWGSPATVAAWLTDPTPPMPVFE